MRARIVLIALLVAVGASACRPVRTTSKVGFKTARVATKTAWEIGKAGTTVATAPLRIGGGGGGGGSEGGSYRVRGRTYRPMSPREARGFRETGMASYYSGGKTASGERATSRSMTAAHKTLPFGARVRVTNLDNGRSIVVRINDRGPFVRGRIIDLTKRGADQLGFRRAGLARVRIEAL